MMDMTVWVDRQVLYELIARMCASCNKLEQESAASGDWPEAIRCKAKREVLQALHYHLDAIGDNNGNGIVN